ncbi:MAG: ChbG/HpnK family deacetylase [Xanthobacteraceae bacterium]
MVDRVEHRVAAPAAGGTTGDPGSADAHGLRRIWLCADDYGIAPGVNAAIRDLIAGRRINATSVMVGTPGFSRSEALALSILNAGVRHASIGLHVTLTAPFRPLTVDFRPVRDGAFLPLPDMMRLAMWRRLDRNALAREVVAQLRGFAAAFGRAPEFVDGHQHVHLLPQVRDAVLAGAAALAPGAWVRQAGSARALHRRLGDRKGLVIAALSRPFRRRARELGIPTNPSFAGTYDFAPQADFSALFPTFLDDLPDGGLIMCHPGLVDAELKRLDPLTDLREREYAYLSGDDFPATLASCRAKLA